jgi:hypothetical protein
MFQLGGIQSPTVHVTKLLLYVKQAEQSAALSLFDLSFVSVLDTCSCE